MSDSPYNDNTKYMALYSRGFHSSLTIKTRKEWNDIYMIDVKSHSDFVEVKKESNNE